MRSELISLALGFSGLRKIRCYEDRCWQTDDFVAFCYFSSINDFVFSTIPHKIQLDRIVNPGKNRASQRFLRQQESTLLFDNPLLCLDDLGGKVNIEFASGEVVQKN